MIQDERIVAAQSLARRFDIGLFYDGVEDLAAQLREPERMAAMRANVWRQRELFAFDTHAPALLGLFREVMERTIPYRSHSRSARG